MKKTTLGLLVALVFLFAIAGPAKAQSSVLWTDDFEGASQWTVTNSPTSQYNYWTLDACNAISGTRSATVKGFGLTNCDVNDTYGIARMYRKFDFKCNYGTRMEFDWKCDFDPRVGVGRVVYSYDGINWDILFGGSFEYWGTSFTQHEYVSLSYEGDRKEIYIGFEFEIEPHGNFGSVNGVIPFTIDNVKISGYTNPAVSAGPDVRGCPGETLHLQGSASFTQTQPPFYHTQTTQQNIMPNSTVTSLLDLTSLPAYVNAADLLSVMVNFMFSQPKHLDIILIAPNGSSIYLMSKQGPALVTGSSHLQFKMDATASPAEYSNTYMVSDWGGMFKPAQSFAALSGPAKGIWQLKIVNAWNYTGIFQSWGMTIANHLPPTPIWSPSIGLSDPGKAQTDVTVHTNTTYTISLTDNYGCTTTDQVEVIVDDLPEFTGPDPVVFANKGESATISITPAEDDYTYQWEVNKKSSWQTLSDNATYSGTAAAQLTISNVSPSMDGNQYRVQVTRCSAIEATSDPVTLSVQTGPGQMVGLAENERGKRYLAVYPNPVVDNLSISYDAKDAREVCIEVFNVIGEKVKEFKKTCIEGQNHLILELSDLTTGIYAVHLEEISVRIVKQ